MICSFTQGAYTTACLFPTSSNFELTKKEYGDKIVYSPQEATSYYLTVNVNCQSYNKTAKTDEAQAWMIDNSLVMSAMSNGGTASVTKVTPFTRAYSLVGIKGDGNNYKYMRLQKDPVTKKQFDEAKAKWEAESKKAIEKSQKEFENHIK